MPMQGCPRAKGLRPNFHVPESAKILNKTKKFLSLAHGSWARNEEQYPRKFSGAEFGHNSIFQGYKVFQDWKMKSR